MFWLIARRASPLVPHLVRGGLAGLFLLSALSVFQLTWGVQALPQSALVIAALGGWLASREIAQPRRLNARSSRPAGTALVWCGVWAAAAPLLCGVCSAALGWTSMELVQQPWFAGLFLTGCCLMTFAPVVCAVTLDLESSARNPAPRGAWLCGAALACGLLPTLLFPGFSMNVLTWTGLAGAVLLRWGPAATRRFLHTPGASTAAPSAIDPRAPVLIGSPPTGKVAPVTLALAALAGAGTCLAGFIASQIVLRSAALDGADLLVWLLAAGIYLVPAGVIRIVPLRPTHRGHFIAALVLAGWIAFLAAGFGMFAWGTLRVNAGTSSLALLLGYRVGLHVLLLAPGAACAGWLVCQSRPGESSTACATRVPCAAAAGYLAALWCALSPETLAIVLAGTGLIIALDRWLRARWTITPGPVSRLAAAACALLVAVGMWFSGNLRPELSDRMLYSPQVYSAVRQGVPAASLRVLDDGRLVAQSDSLRGRVSLWRHRGSQLVTRRNGIPVEFQSTHPDLAPRSVGDTLPALLPLVLHEDARQVLLLGAHVSSLETCHVSPLEGVTVWEGSPASLAMLDWRRKLEESPLTLSGGPEISIQQVDVSLAVHASPQRVYDVIVAPQTPPGDISSAGLLQPEFYRQLQRHLAEHGVFAQRVDYYDLGPDVVRSLLAGFRNSFEHMLVVESIPGELVLLGSRRELVIDEAAINRLRAPQYRMLLGEAGWDWALVPGRGGVTEAGIDKFIAAGAAPAERLPWRLPLEISRWDSKAERTRAALDGHGQALWSLLPESSPVVKEITERIEDQALSYRIQSEHPDDPWSYRVALKTRLQDRPRSVIQPVKHEGLKRILHPEDRRRMDYLEALGVVALQPHPPAEEVQRLTDHVLPFDPLISQFARYEAASLLSRAAEPDEPQRLRYLLYTAYFAPGADRSVRNVGDAMTQLSHDNSSLTSEQQFDHLNGMAQLLLQRWQARWASAEQSKYERQDATHSVAALELALPVLRAEHASAGYPDDLWDAREEYLRHTLLHPLQKQRTIEPRKKAVAPRP